MNRYILSAFFLALVIPSISFAISYPTCGLRLQGTWRIIYDVTEPYAQGEGGECEIDNMGSTRPQGICKSRLTDQTFKTSNLSYRTYSTSKGECKFHAVVVLENLKIWVLDGMVNLGEVSGGGALKQQIEGKKKARGVYAMLKGIE